MTPRTMSTNAWRFFHPMSRDASHEICFFALSKYTLDYPNTGTLEKPSYIQWVIPRPSLSHDSVSSLDVALVIHPGVLLTGTISCRDGHIDYEHKSQVVRFHWIAHEHRSNN